MPDARHARLPIIGVVKARVSRPVEGRVLNATVKRVPSGRHFCVLTCTDCPKPDIPEGRIEVLGVDVGIRCLMARPDGDATADPRSLACVLSSRREQDGHQFLSSLVTHPAHAF